jgi:hypothetical protein
MMRPSLREAKTALGLTGIVAGLAGMALRWRGLVYAAVVLLALAVVLRIVERKRAAPAD